MIQSSYNKFLIISLYKKKPATIPAQVALFDQWP